MDTDNPRRRPWLATVLVLTAVVALAAMPVLVKARKANRQRAAVEAIKRLGGLAIYDFECAELRAIGSASASASDGPPGPAWVRDRFGIDWVADVVSVYLCGPDPRESSDVDPALQAIIDNLDVDDPLIRDFDKGSLQGLVSDLIRRRRPLSDVDMAHLQPMTRLECLRIDRTMVTDSGLRHLEGLKNLQTLGLSETKITDTGLHCLEGLKRLEILDLSETEVSDAGLKSLGGLTSLVELNLSNTKVVGPGLQSLTGLKSLRTLDLSGTEIDDSGLRHLAGLTGLATLNLSCTKITDAGLQHLAGMRCLQTLSLSGTAVKGSGLRYLSGLKQLEALDLEALSLNQEAPEAMKGLQQLRVLRLNEGHVTPDAARKLQAAIQAALPHCDIIWVASAVTQSATGGP